MVVNLQKCYEFGVHLMADISALNLGWVEKNFPLLTGNQLMDQDVMVHSLGCSVWNTFGHELGYMAVVECPAPGTFGADIRSDSGWFEKGHSQPFSLIEFERYDGSDKGQLKLEEKLKNLLEAAQRWQYSPKLLVLSAWSQGLVSAPDTKRLREICRLGFTSSTGTYVSVRSDVEVIFSRFQFIKNATKIGLDILHNEALI